MMGWRQVRRRAFAIACVAATPAFAAEAPLADTVESGDGVAARALLTSVDVNAAQVDGMTALHWAVLHDDIALVRDLLLAGADAGAANRYGVVPLAIASTNGNADIIAELLKAGADANAALRGGETPLMTAARTGRLEPVRLLLRHGAEVNARLPGGQTALMWAAADGHAAVVEELLAAGADFRTPVATGFTPLLFAVRAGHTEIVRLLLDAGGRINECAQPTAKGFKTLRDGMAPLTLAIENGRFQLAAQLLDWGANPNDMRSGYAPLHILTWIRKPDSGEDEGDPLPLDRGAMTSEELIRKLVAQGADVNAQLTRGPSSGGRIARTGCTPFLLAADTADTPYMRLLIELGADPTITNVDGCTPIMAAAGLGTRAALEEAGTEEEALEAVAYLLELGADINAVSNLGDTAMHGAAFANFPRVVAWLDAQGADIAIWNQPNHRGWTPLRIAEGHRYGNFKPSFETVAAIKAVMTAHGVEIPPPMEPIPERGYDPPG
jgi:ankyrin repeat protein